MTESILMDFFFVIRCAHAFTNDHFTFESQQQHFLNCESGKKSKTEKKTHTDIHKPLVTCITRYATNEIS